MLLKKPEPQKHLKKKRRKKAGPVIEGRIWGCITTGELTFAFLFIYL